jgi:5-hydroxyisourate hydrolase/2-oxo-4-hydroxy-4-carboxy-5-ureidoimidazoline decarboxylase
MELTEFNKLELTAAIRLLKSCCGSAKWTQLLADKIPFADEKAFIKLAENIWYNECGEADWLEAFTHHPKIGDTKLLAEKFASTQHLASAEQASVQAASQQVLEELAALNKAYETQFGFIFIVCATGKSATEMLRLLQDRIKNSYNEELHIAMGEQHKITILRLQKLVDNPLLKSLAVSQLTTHVLDTAIGRPGKNITIRLKHLINNIWQTMAQGLTNSDGRVADLLPPEKILLPNNYKLVFETARYFADNKIKGFYPEVEIQFAITDDTHYHVPLLINPFGYSTYRGS